MPNISDGLCNCYYRLTCLRCWFYLYKNVHGVKLHVWIKLTMALLEKKTIFPLFINHDFPLAHPVNQIFQDSVGGSLFYERLGCY